MKRRDLIKKLESIGFVFDRHGSRHDVTCSYREGIIMKKIYPVIFTQTKKAVLVEVPDMEILTEGKDLTDAIDMARDAVGLMGISLEDDGLDIPEPTSLEKIDPSTGTFAGEGDSIVSLVDIDFLYYRRKLDNKAVRRNVTLPNWLNQEADMANINVSKVLQDALMQKLGVSR